LALGKSILFYDKVDTNKEIFDKIDEITSESLLEIANETFRKEDFSTLIFR